MFRITRQRPYPAVLDLATMRETLYYMKDDARRVPGLEGVAAALNAAITEIEAAERKSMPVTYSPIMSRFLPMRI